ncbi:hypothetical protein ACO2JO_04810 [Leptospira interrogans]
MAPMPIFLFHQASPSPVLALYCVRSASAFSFVSRAAKETRLISHSCVSMASLTETPAFDEGEGQMKELEPDTWRSQNGFFGAIGNVSNRGNRDQVSDLRHCQAMSGRLSPAAFEMVQINFPSADGSFGSTRVQPR